MHRQAERHHELSNLSKQLSAVNGAAATGVLKRIDQVIHEAAAVERVETPEQAIASLEIALDAMGADREHPLPQERLILQAVAFLQMLLAFLTIAEETCSPSIGGAGIIVSKMTGLA